ncbi:Hypothetical predicted protein [Podarcis lilfordi]|uniref:Uncharacterized protein n=1 Tax=Podarcis lilfordi TaxID=74358 RepID=A0AA35KJ54_9SAUR|nr:Hypothetical predicted protein [Podarcis lilfordi]
MASHLQVPTARCYNIAQTSGARCQSTAQLSVPSFRRQDNIGPPNRAWTFAPLNLHDAFRRLDSPRPRTLINTGRTQRNRNRKHTLYYLLKTWPSPNLSPHLYRIA